MDIIYRDIKKISLGLKMLRKNKGYSSCRSFADCFDLDPKHHWHFSCRVPRCFSMGKSKGKGR